MIKKVILGFAIAFVAAWSVVSSYGQRETAAGKATAEVAAATQKFLELLDDTQRGQVSFDFNDAEQRKRWSNLPVSSVRRAGLRMGDLTQPQREAALRILSATLSASGYEKVLQIVEADEVLRSARKGGGKAGGKAGGGPGFGRDNYYISLLGKPSGTEPWMIQFGGHHLGINITLAGDRSTLAPSHTGVQPARYEMQGKMIRPLGREVDKAFALLSSLDESQRKKAILGFEMRDLALGPGRDGQMIQPEGIKGSELTEKQREMMVDLVSEWTGILHDAAAAAKLQEVQQNVAETWFAWSGPTEQGGAAYFRVHGPTVFVEYAPQRLGGDPTNHIHTIYRDPTNEYGAKWWKS